MQGIEPWQGEFYRRNGIFEEGVEPMFNTARWHVLRVDRVTSMHVGCTVVKGLILEEGSHFSCRLTDFTSNFFDQVGIEVVEGLAKFLTLQELIEILCQADGYLELFGYRYEEDGHGLLPAEALSLAGVPQDIAHMTGSQLCVAEVRLNGGVSPHLRQLKYEDAGLNLHTVVEWSIGFYLGNMAHRLERDRPDAFKRLISRLRELCEL